jgi:hypothetical protein
MKHMNPDNPAAPPALFDSSRLPDLLFGPLASANRRHHWNLLVNVYREFFSAESRTPTQEGVLQGQLNARLAEYIERIPDWLDDDGAPLNTAIGIRTAGLIQQFTRAGWLRKVVHGARTFYRMPPTVQRFLEILIQFADEGPVLIGGKVQVIYNTVLQVRKNPAEQVGAFSDAARQVRSLISLLKSTQERVREVIATIGQQQETAELVRRFFNEYAARLLIADFHEMFTANHPLAHRDQILAEVDHLRSEPTMRDKMVESYRITMRTPTREAAIQRFERDVSDYELLHDVGNHLSALRLTVAQCTARAVAILQYRLRNSRIADVIDQAIAAATAADAHEIPINLPLARGRLACEANLMKPRAAPALAIKVPLEDETLTPEEEALSRQRRAMREARTVTPAAIRGFLDRQGESKQPLRAEQLKVDSVQDLFVLAALYREATQMALRPPEARHRPRQSLQLPAGVHLHHEPGLKVTESPWITGQGFVLHNNKGS